jgi:hypothetical protein
MFGSPSRTLARFASVNESTRTVTGLVYNATINRDGVELMHAGANTLTLTVPAAGTGAAATGFGTIGLAARLRRRGW